MKNISPALPPLLCFLLLAGCIHIGNNGGEDFPEEKIDTQPEGPAVEAAKVSADGATVAPADETGRFALGFPAQNGSPGAVFTFADTSLVDRMGMALDVTNTGSGPVRVFADLNQDLSLIHI